MGLSVLQLFAGPQPQQVVSADFFFLNSRTMGVRVFQAAQVPAMMAIAMAV